MKHFGKLVQHLKLDYSYYSEKGHKAHHWRQAERLIFAHCTDTLKRIEIDCGYNNHEVKIMEELRKPFNNVEELSSATSTKSTADIAMMTFL